MIPSPLYQLQPFGDFVGKQVADFRVGDITGEDGIYLGRSNRDLDVCQFTAQVLDFSAPARAYMHVEKGGRKRVFMVVDPPPAKEVELIEDDDLDLDHRDIHLWHKFPLVCRVCSDWDREAVRTRVQLDGVLHMEGYEILRARVFERGDRRLLCIDAMEGAEIDHLT
jgi:hypothetical protein